MAEEAAAEIAEARRAAEESATLLATTIERAEVAEGRLKKVDAQAQAAKEEAQAAVVALSCYVVQSVLRVAA